MSLLIDVFDDGRIEIQSESDDQRISMNKDQAAGIYALLGRHVDGVTMIDRARAERLIRAAGAWKRSWDGIVGETAAFGPAGLEPGDLDPLP